MRSSLLLTAALVLVVAQAQEPQLNLGTPAAPGTVVPAPAEPALTTTTTAPPTTFPPATPPPGTSPPETTPPPETTGTTAAQQATPPPQQQQEGWEGCVDPSKPDELIRIGKKTTICLVLASSTEWNVLAPATKYLRLSFQPQADEYSRFHVPSSYQDLIVATATTVFDGNNNVTVHVSSQQTLSFQRLFYTPNAGAGRVFPYLTAIIDVHKGVVKGITWDDACMFCSKDRCVENTYDFNGNPGTQEEYGQPTKACFVPQTDCTKNNFASAIEDDGKPICDINLYVVWTGDDADGRAMQSSAFRFSAFPEQEIQNRISNNLPDNPLSGFSVFGGGNNDEETTAATGEATTGQQTTNGAGGSSK